ncbi:hypothetical protein [Siminovitchia fordii]|uniref:Uncharacterized protein n=1 Tax=Siminovitchia fordii TaxID=254759 RepID=A0ABQ4K6U3_9BACI|nr:hypothetical protein [Siminovitchia fordii]GIN20735.1 hypothetical protein J1TS3_18690 [Siminovitchia fordii]
MAKFFMHVCRLFLSVVFLIAGINGYFVIFGLEPFIATSSKAMALFQLDNLLIFEKSLEILCGVLLLSNQFIPLAIAILSPIVANILLLHLFLDPSLLLLAILLVLAYGCLLFFYRKNFISLIERKPSPGSDPTAGMR